MTATLSIFWHEGDATGYTDLLPLSWFSSQGKHIALEHKVIGPRFGKYKAKCSVSVNKRVADLDYTSFKQHNESNGMELGVMRIKFQDQDRRKAASVYWKDQGETDFVHCNVTLSAAIRFSDLPYIDVEDIDEATIEVVEGDNRLVTHLKRERNRALIEKKRRQYFSDHGNLACEVCRFDFGAKYGMLGESFAEVHHRIPIAQGRRVTKLSELAILCANCHRMIHKTNLMMTIDDFKNYVKLD